jgi:hypothetical protein
MFSDARDCIQLSAPGCPMKSGTSLKKAGQTMAELMLAALVFLALLGALLGHTESKI